MYPSDFPPVDLALGTAALGLHGLRLDLLHRRDQHAPAPAILHLHGGAWVRYGRWAVANTFLARAGFVTASADYRLAPGAVFPAQLEDVQAAAAWLRVNAKSLNINPDRIGVWGVSAGGHLAALLGATSRPGDPWRVQAVASVSGPMDFLDPAFPLPPEGESSPLLGGPLARRRALARAASPVTHASAQTPPTLLLHGLHDAEVPVSQSRRMHAALRAVGAVSERTELEGDHFINDTHQQEVEARLLAFFRRELA